MVTFLFLYPLSSSPLSLFIFSLSYLFLSSLPFHFLSILSSSSFFLIFFPSLPLPSFPFLACDHNNLDLCLLAQHVKCGLAEVLIVFVHVGVHSDGVLFGGCGVEGVGRRVGGLLVFVVQHCATILRVILHCHLVVHCWWWLMVVLNSGGDSPLNGYCV